MNLTLQIFGGYAAFEDAVKLLAQAFISIEAICFLYVIPKEAIRTLLACSTGLRVFKRHDIAGKNVEPPQARSLMMSITN